MSLLENVTVVSTGKREATAYCAKLLRDAGADVVKVEPPGGDPRRRSDPHYAMYLDGGSRSVVADLETEAGRATLLGLAERADVVLCDRPEVVDIPALRERNAALVVVTLSDYGRDGPNESTPASELTLQAESGIMALHDTAGGPPVVTGVPLGECKAGVDAALGTVMALLVNRGGHEAVDVDVSKFESLISLLLSPWLFDKIDGHDAYPVPARAIPGIEQAADGWVCVVCVTTQQWVDFKKIAGVPGLDDPRFDDLAGRTVRSAEVTPLVRSFTRRHTVAELVELGAHNRVPIAPAGKPDDLPTLPPYATRGTYVHNEQGGFLQPRPPFRVGGEPDWVPARLADVGADAGWPHGERRPTGLAAATPPDPARPLEGLRVVEFGLFQAGPLSTVNLAYLGADVVKVESVNRPDLMRFSGVPMREDRAWEKGGVWNAANLGKRAITADLSNPRGIEIMTRLIGSSDVLIDNYGPRVLERCGLDYPAVHVLRPDIVMIRMPAWGLDGPWRDRPGFTYTADATSGMTALTGFPDGEPLLTGTIVDPMAAAVSSFITMAALLRRQRTGEGAFVEVALCDVAPQLTAGAVIEASGRGRVRSRNGNRNDDVIPQGAYKCSDREWVAVSITTDEQWRSFAALPGLPPSAADPRLAELAGRRSRLDEAESYLARYCEAHPAAAVIASLRSVGIPAAPVSSGRELADHPQLRSRQRIFTVERALIGELDYIGYPMRFSFAPAMAMPRPAPLFGQDNRDILTELGFSHEEITDLTAAGVIGDSPFGITRAPR
jgi:crotonobetainyl-CoA:carnitine CoA-transferase CaiB-like acyl-CoA transferase